MKSFDQGIRRLFLLFIVLLMFLAGCGPEQMPGPSPSVPVETGLPAETNVPETAVPQPATEVPGTEPAETGRAEETEGIFYAHVNGRVLTIRAEENSSAEAFLSLLKTGNVTVDMHDYGNFEKVGSLGTSLPQNDEQITTEAGDVILYQGNQITIYYDVNRWSFTRLGKIQDVSRKELMQILGDGDCTVTFSLSAEMPEAEQGKVLVVVFSCTGHTKPLAEYIAEELHADLFEIQAKDPYTEEDIRYYTDCRADREHKDPAARPEIDGELPDMTKYDTVFVGYPIWYGQAPKILYTFLERVNLSGKRVVPFCTSHSSPLGSSAENLHFLAPYSQWEAGRRFAIGTGKEEIAEWVCSLHIRMQ